MPPKDSKGKKSAPTASEKESSKPAKNPDKGKAKNESTQKVQNDESEKDKEIKALQLRVDFLEKNMNLKVFQTSSGFSIAEEDQLARWQDAFKSAEKDLIMLKKGLTSSGNGNVPGSIDESMRLTEKIDTLEKEISKRDMAITSIQTKLDEANSALDGMRKQLRTELNNLNKIITDKDKIMKDLESEKIRLDRDILKALSKRPSPKESPRNSSSKSQSSDGNTSAKLTSLEKEIKSKDSEMSILKDKITQLESTAIRKPTDGNTSATLAAYNESMQSKDSEIKNLNEKIKKIESKVISDSQSYAQLQDTIKEKEDNITDLQSQLASLSKEKEDNITDLQSQLASLRTELQQKEEMIRVQDKNNKPEITLTTNTNLQEQLKEKESKIKGLEIQLASVSNNLKGNEEKIHLLEEEMSTLKDQNKREIHRLASDLGGVKKDLEIKNGELLSLQDKKKKIESELSELKTKRESQNNESMKKQINDKDTEIGKKTSEIAALKKEIEDLKKTNSLRREKTMDKTASPGRDDVGVLKQQLSKANQEIEELKSRLSKMVGENLTNNNPNITDLSDENRPTKLAEMYSEIYDNEWTDAFEELAKHEKNETDVIAELLRILQNTAKFCGNVADRYIESLQKSASRLQDKSSTKNQFKKLHLLKELRKSYAPSLAEEVYSLYVEENGKPQKVEAYTKSCIRLCWLMSVQDPRVVLDEVKTPTPFDADRYKTYTKSGKQMAYVVWPTMLLNEGGPILMKGVAQGK